MKNITEREGLDLIRATATRSVPNCINLQAIDRILADVARAASPILVDQDAAAEVGDADLAGLKPLGRGVIPNAQTMAIVAKAGAARYPNWKTSDFESASLNGFTKGCLATLRALSTTPAAPPVTVQAGGAGGWISVDERLPQPIEGSNITPKALLLYADGQISTGKVWSQSDGMCSTPDDRWLVQNEPTHWQPLPAAPIQ